MLTVEQVERLLDNHRLQVQGYGGKWCNVRRNGATRRKVRSSRVSIPVKFGFREAFRIEFADGIANYGLRERPEA